IPEFNVPPGSSKEITIPLNMATMDFSRERFLKVVFELKDDAQWVSAGHIVAWDQFPLPVKSRSATNELVADSAPVGFIGNQSAYIVISGSSQFEISKETGALTGLSVAGKAILSTPLESNFWRPPTDNDRGNKMPEKLAIWRTASAETKLISITAGRNGPSSVTITIKYDLAGGNAELYVNYVVNGDGSIQLRNYLKVSDDTPLIPRIGMQASIQGELSNVKWYGRGPRENYDDRKTGAAVGEYSARADDLFFYYVRPQETGNHVDVRWVEFTDDQGFGLRVEGKPVINFSVWPYTMEQIEAATHPTDLKKNGPLTINIDLRQMGVGGDDSWGAWPQD
ncbi:MAG: DUF4981 domain-containing protein, partial [Victivallales bacterium]|nr:DUF4981 domain-containing protein [Victivallales bacterium]